jgi:hypothetical protein
MKKDDLKKENEILSHENKLLKLKLEQEEIYNSVQRYKLEKRIQELEEHIEKIHGNTHAIGFQLIPLYDENYNEE